MPPPDEFDAYFQKQYGQKTEPKPAAEDEFDSFFQKKYGAPHVDTGAKQLTRTVKALPDRRIRERMVEELSKPASTPAMTSANLETAAAIGREPRALQSQVNTLTNMSAVRTGGVTPAVMEAQDAVLQAQRDKPKPQGIGEIVKQRWREGAFGKLDIPDEIFRQVVTPGHEFGSKPISVAESFDKFKAAAENPGPLSWIHKPYVGAVQGAGKAIGSAIMAPVYGYDTAKKVLGEPTDPALISEMEAGSQKTGSELVHGLLASPLNLVSFGAYGGGKSTAGALARELGAVGVADDVAKASAKAAQAVVSEHGATPGAIKAIEDIVAGTGISAKDQARVIANVSGRGGELLEAGGLRIHAPLLPQYGVDAASMVPAALRRVAPAVAERAGAKAIRAGADALALGKKIPDKTGVGAVAKGVVGSTEWLYDRAFPWLRPAANQARADVAMGRGLEHSKNKTITDEIKKVMSDAPVDMKRQEQIFREYLDPDHTNPLRVGSPEYAAAATENLRTRGAEVRFKRKVKGEKEPVEFAVFGSVLNDLSPAEKQWAESVVGLFDRYHKELVGAGLLKPEQYGRNLLTGKYVPRMLSGPVDDAADIAKGLREGSGYSPVKGRDAASGGTPLGSYPELLADPARVMTNYSGAANRLLAKAEVEKALATKYGSADKIPPEAKAIVDLAFDKSTFRASHALKKRGFKGFGAVMAGYEDLVGIFKENVLTRVPGFLAMNMSEDSAKMFAAGATNPAIFSDAAKTLLGRGKVNLGGKMVSAKDAAAEIREAGQAWGTANRTDLYGESPLDAIRSSTVRGAVKRGENPGAKALAGEAWKLTKKGADWGTLGPQGRFFNQKWDDYSKTALHLHYRRAGFSAAEAARLSREVLLDYADLSNPLVAGARTVAPFAQWLMKQPLGAAKMAARQPGRVNTVGRVVDATVGDRVQDDVYMPPGYERKRGDPRIPGPGGQAFMRMLLEDATGEAPAENQRFYVNPRMPWAEIHNMLSNSRSLRGAGETLVSQLDPALMTIGEMLLGRDVRNMRPLGQALDQRTIEALRSQPYGPGWVLDALAGDPTDPEAASRSAAQTGAHGQRNLPTFIPYLGSPIVMQLLNQQLQDESDPGSPLNTVGMYRPPQMAPADTSKALQWARLLTRWGIGLTGPDEPWRDYLRNPEREYLETVTKPAGRQVERAYPYPAK